METAAEEHPPEEQKDSCGCWIGAVVVVCVVVLVVLVSVVIYLSRAADITIFSETFDEGDAGWLVVGDAQAESEAPTHRDRGGNPGPYLSAVDDAVGGVWYWAAPPAFREDVSKAWRKRDGAPRFLHFDLKQSEVSDPFDDEDVILSDGETTIAHRHAAPPNAEWTPYAVPLADPAKWRNSATGEAPTAAELDAVLGGLEKLWIRGEFRTGPDEGGLDNPAIR